MNLGQCNNGSIITCIHQIIADDGIFIFTCLLDKNGIIIIPARL